MLTVAEREVQQRKYQRPPLDAILSHLNSVSTTTHKISKDRFNIIVPSPL